MTNCKELFIVTDKVSGEEMAYFSANNDREAVRTLVNMGLFKMYRIKDIKLESAGICKFDKIGEVNIEEVLKGLEYHIENKAEEIKGTKEEVEKKIIDKVEKGK